MCLQSVCDACKEGMIGNKCDQCHAEDRESHATEDPAETPHEVNGMVNEIMDDIEIPTEQCEVVVKPVVHTPEIFISFNDE